jgi:hypothetical protein
MGRSRGDDPNWRPFGWSTPRLLLAGLCGTLLVLLVVVGSTSTVGFSPHNANWDGTGEFQELAERRGETVTATDVSRYETVEPETTTAIVIAPEQPYSAADSQRVRQFVESGGTLVVADSGASGNALLTDIGASARFDGAVLRDDRHNFRSSAMAVATNTSSHSLVSGVDQLTLNYGTAIEPGESTPILNSSAFAYLDSDGSGSVDQDTELRQYPVVTVESVGEGQVVAVGDPSLFINSMLDEPDNRPFATTLVDQRPVTVLDRSHAASRPPLVAGVQVARSSPVAAAGLVAALVGLVAVLGGRYRWREFRQAVENVRQIVPTGSQTGSTATIESKPVASREALAAQLREQHPDWDESRLNRVITGILSQRTNESPDE